MYLGIDIGSSSSKAAIIDENRNILATCCINRGTGTDGVEEALGFAYREAGNRLYEMGLRTEDTPVTREEIQYAVVTGYGRLLYKGADKQVTEITCHARGASFLVPGIRMVIDIGGQDSKVIKLGADGTVSDFVMNEKCAAGTGRFLEVMARVLGCQLSDLSDLAAASAEDVAISSVCTVFAESEAISRLASGCTAADVAKGAHRSVARRIVGMAGRVGFKELAGAATGAGDALIAMTGGVALNSNMVETMGEELGIDIKAAPYPQAVGAIGAALIAWDRAHR